MSDNGASEPGAPAGNEVIAQEFFEAIAGAVQAFAPGLDPNRVRDLSRHTLAESQQLNQVISDATNPEKQAAYPRWGFKVIDIQSKREIGVSVSPKKLQMSRSPEELVGSIYTIALLTSPIARAVMRAHGFDILFFQAPEQNQNRIITPGS